MFKKIVMTLLALCVLLPVSQANAASDKKGIYVAPKFVLNIQNSEWSLDGIGSTDETKTKAGGALAVGYDFAYNFNVPVRAELEYAVYGDVSKTENVYGIDLEGKVGFQTLLANVYYDIAKWNDFTPYIGAGLGMAFLKTEVTEPVTGFSVDDSKTVFAGQIGLGCAYAINDSVSVDLGYRYLMMGNGDIELLGQKVGESDTDAHQFMLGVRFTF